MLTWVYVGVYSRSSTGNRVKLTVEYLEDIMSATGGNTLVSVQPEELKFQVELDKQSFCDLKVSNNTENHVAFKVKTTSPKKYFVRPNTGVIQPWDQCIIRVTLQAQREYPPDMQCKDKFLLQSTTVSPNTDIDDLPPDTFNKEAGKVIEECKLRVAYIAPASTLGSSEDELQRTDPNSVLQRLKEERDVAVRQTQSLRQELDMMKRRRSRKGDPMFSFVFAVSVGLIGLVVGLILSVFLAKPVAE